MEQPNSVFHIHDNFANFLQVIGKAMTPDKLEVSDQYTRCLTGIPHPLGNIIIAGEQTEAEFKVLLEEMEKWTQTNSTPVALAMIPAIGLAGRATWVAQRNWTLLDNMPGMWMELPDEVDSSPMAPGISVGPVLESDELKSVTNILTEGYPVPSELADFFMRGIQLVGNSGGDRLANVLATIEGEPAACASVSVHDGVAGIYCVATLESFRGLGLGTAVTRMAMSHGRRMGATHALLHASEMGVPIYQKIGFKEICRVPVYGFGMQE